MKTLLLFLLSFSSIYAFAGDGEITGHVKDSVSGGTVIGANVLLVSGEKTIQNTVTDIDGFYTLTHLPSGTYNIKISSVGFQTLVYTGIKVYSDQPTTINLSLSTTILEAVTVTSAGRDGEINIGFEIGNDRASAIDLQRSAIRPEQYIATFANAFQADYDQPITFRGSRVGTTLYMVDGMRIIGEPSLPLNSIEEEMVFSGGIPAKYGDTVGGVVVINTKSFHFY